MEEPVLSPVMMPLTSCHPPSAAQVVPDVAVYLRPELPPAGTPSEVKQARPPYIFTTPVPGPTWKRMVILYLRPV